MTNTTIDYTPIDTINSNYVIKNSQFPSTICINNTSNKEVVRIDPQGRIYWLGREVTTDEEFRQTMLELHKSFTKTK
jgi:hypothetical protein